MNAHPIQTIPQKFLEAERSVVPLAGGVAPIRCSTGQTSELLCVAGLDGYFKYLNPAWTVQMGWTVEELLGRPLVDFAHPEDRAASLAELAKLNAGASTIAFANRYLHRDGTYRWLEWTAKPVRGQPFVRASARDVTDQRWLEKEIVEISDREKDRLGRDLHDGLCQTLAGIAALSTALSRQLAPEHKAASAAAAEISRLLNDANTAARSLAHGLNPVELNGVGLIGALDALAINTQALFDVSCTFRCNHPSVRLNAEVETHLFRIVQEAVGNALRHAGAKKISVALRFGKGKGTLSIRDDGVGIAAHAGHGNGLHTMAYRARLVGASLWVQPHPSRGTRVDCVFGMPCTPEERERHD